MNSIPAIGDWRLRFAAFSLLLAPAAFALPSSKPADEIPPLSPPLPEIQPTFWEQHAALIIVLGFVALAAIGALLWLVLRPKPKVTTPPEVIARNELARLATLPETGDVLSRISQTLRRYVAAAFALPSGEMNTAEFCAAINAHPQIDPELSAKLAEFLHSCDERKFAPTTNTTPLSAASRALALVELAEARRAKLREQAQALKPA
ncbi:MAG: hypothetical protein RLY20_2042 [Verrucomicrobiota bacterium]